jgi:hypothetical protein
VLYAHLLIRACTQVAEQMEHLLPVMISTEAEEDTANPRGGFQSESESNSTRSTCSTAADSPTCRVPMITDRAEIMARFVRSPKVEQDGALGTQDMDVEMVAT